MDTRDVLTVNGGRRLARSARGWACALALVSSMAPGLASADAVLASAEEETPAPMPFQLPAASASASAELESTGLPDFSLMLMLLSGALVAGTLSALFRSLSSRDHSHPAPSQRW